MARKKKQSETKVENQPETKVVEIKTESVAKTGSVAVLANAIRHNGRFYAKGCELTAQDVETLQSIGLESYIITQ
jgi:hypothetical protein